MNKGIIVSVQGQDMIPTESMAKEIMNALAVAVRTDKPIRLDIPIIGLQKIKVLNKLKEPYITPSINDIEKVARWADYVAIDYRICNKNLKKISDYCRNNDIRVIADIMTKEDYHNIIDNNYHFDYIATTISVLNPGNKRNYPDKKLVKYIIDCGTKNVIAEGNYSYRKDVKEILKYGAHAVCIGAAITDIYKKTRLYTSINYDN